MKKKVFLGSIVAIAVMTVAGWNISQSKSAVALSDVALANVEALAQESGGSGSLYGNSEGTRFCCCPGTNGCGAASCSGC